ncbi:MAG: hypothetical protein ACTS43_00310 [Candidatus Hodgkinia cicadicola]
MIIIETCRLTQCGSTFARSLFLRSPSQGSLVLHILRKHQTKCLSIKFPQANVASYDWDN